MTQLLGINAWDRGINPAGGISPVERTASHDPATPLASVRDGWECGVLRGDLGRNRDAAGAGGVMQVVVSGTTSPPEHLRVAAANGVNGALAEFLRRESA